MRTVKYTPEQMASAERVHSLIESVSPDKRPIVTLMTESFINGMKAQEQISAAQLLNTGQGTARPSA